MTLVLAQLSSYFLETKTIYLSLPHKQNFPYWRFMVCHMVGLLHPCQAYNWNWSRRILGRTQDNQNVCDISLRWLKRRKTTLFRWYNKIILWLWVSFLPEEGNFLFSFPQKRSKQNNIKYINQQCPKSIKNSDYIFRDFLDPLWLIMYNKAGPIFKSNLDFTYTSTRDHKAQTDKETTNKIVLLYNRGSKQEKCTTWIPSAKCPIQTISSSTPRTRRYFSF